jgi:ATP-dependent Lhr-like helicase
VLTREQVLAEGIAGGFAAIYPELSALETLGVARRGYFVEGLGGAQFALPGAVERLRAPAGASGGVDGVAQPALVLAALDPAQPYGAAMRWPARGGAGAAGARGPARVAGAFVVLVGGDPVLYVERSGRGLLTLADAGDPRIEQAVGALVEAVTAGRLPRLAVERVDGGPALDSPLGALLIAAGFREGPRRLTLSA